MASEGRLCVRFYRRKDGTTLTQNCPIGLRALKRRASRLASAAAAVTISFFAGVGVAPADKESEPATSGPVYAAAEDETYAMAGGMTVSPLEIPQIQGGILGSVIFLIGYPLLKIRQRKEARERETLRIWRQE
jgi:hypothetical protein